MNLVEDAREYLARFIEGVSGLREVPGYGLQSFFNDPNRHSYTLSVLPQHEILTLPGIIAWYMAKNPDKTCLIASPTVTNANILLEEVRRFMATNTYFQEVFPNVEVDEKRPHSRGFWLTGHDSPRQPTLTCAYGSSYREILGRRYTGLVFLYGVEMRDFVRQISMTVMPGAKALFAQCGSTYIEAKNDRLY